MKTLIFIIAVFQYTQLAFAGSPADIEAEFNQQMRPINESNAQDESDISSWISDKMSEQRKDLKSAAVREFLAYFKQTTGLKGATVVPTVERSDNSPSAILKLESGELCSIFAESVPSPDAQQVRGQIRAGGQCTKTTNIASYVQNFVNQQKFPFVPRQECILIDKMLFGRTEDLPSDIKTLLSRSDARQVDKISASTGSCNHKTLTSQGASNTNNETTIGSGS